YDSGSYGGSVPNFKITSVPTTTSFTYTDPAVSTNSLSGLNGTATPYNILTVTGTHTYVNNDLVSVSVTVSEPGVAGGSSFGSGLVAVTEADLSVTATPITTTENAALSG